MANSNSIKASKSALRKMMSGVLNLLANEEIAKQSEAITIKIINSPEWKEAQRISVYLSMPKAEVQTDAIALASLRAGKVCFVPLCTKDRMFMLRVKDEEDLKSLPANSWGIREPKPVEGRENALETGGLDLIICPGVAFTSSGSRLGHGKGYYDKFLKELQVCHQTARKPMAHVLAIALREQIVEEIPINEDDVPITNIVTADD